MNVEGLKRIVDYISEVAVNGRFTVDGSIVLVPLRMEKDDTRLKIIMYLPANELSQSVSKVELIDDRGVVVDSKTGVVEKPARKGLWEAFEYTWVSEVN